MYVYIYTYIYVHCCRSMKLYRVLSQTILLYGAIMDNGLVLAKSDPTMWKDLGTPYPSRTFTQ